MQGQQSILVTGGCGYIGSYAVNQLSHDGYQVVVIDDLSSGHKQNLLNNELLVQGDIADEDLVKKTIRAHNISSVMHFAARVVAPESVEKPLEYYEANTSKSLRFLKACRDAQIQKLIFSSTAAVYGLGDGVHPCDELDVPRPLNPYGCSKLMTEWMLRDLARASEMRFVALRYFNAAGAHPNGRLGQRSQGTTHLIQVACEAALGIRNHVMVYGTDYETRDGTGVRDYVHLHDIAAAHVLALKYLEQDGESQTLNCGSGTGHTVNEVINAVRRVSGKNFDVKTGPRRPGDPASLIARTTRIKEVLGWTPQFQDLDFIVKTVLDWQMKLRSER